MKILFQHPALIEDDLINKITTSLTGNIHRISATCIAVNNTYFDTQVKHSINTLLANTQVDIAYLNQPLQWSDFKLLAMDMDSTLINIECIDEIADMCGRKTEVAAITEAAMRGEITDFNESLHRRLAILAGTEASVLQRVLDERLQLNPGAETLIQTAHNHGLQTLLVSGGFTFFTQALQKRLNLNHSYANQLDIQNGILTGKTTGTIINAQAKANAVQTHCKMLNVPSRAAICIGDGANDLNMMAISGLSVAYHAKPRVQAEANISLNHVGLDGLLPILSL